jgi:hypothetical protein
MSPDTCLCEAKASHSQRTWAEVSSSAPHLLHSGLSDSPIRWRCLLRVLRPARRPVTALDCVLLKDRNLAVAPRQGPEISSQACLGVSPRSCHLAQCWLTNQHLILLHLSCLETPKTSSGPWNLTAELSLASSWAISFPHTSACPETQHSLTACWVEISFNVFWHCWINGDVLTAWRAFKVAWSHGDYCMWHSVTENNLLQDTTVWYDTSATNQNTTLQNKVISHAIL